MRLEKANTIVRLDVFLVDKKLASSRTQAQELILLGYVFLKKLEKETILKKSSYLVQDSEQDFIFIKSNEIQKYVSRGGLKLEQALKKIQLKLKSKIVLDIGQSTGGFTDCLLQSDVEKVVGIDVGHSQLHENIKSNFKVVFFENVHVKDLKTHLNFKESVPSAGFDLIVADVSFISLTKVIPHISPFLKKGGDYLLLVKPQFELSKKELDKNGIVKNPKGYALVKNQIEDVARLCFGDVISYFESETLGKDGNQEFFIYGQRSK